jgi:hypothetical protein
MSHLTIYKIVRTMHEFSPSFDLFHRIIMLAAIVVLSVACESFTSFSEGEIARVDGETITADDLSRRFWRGPTDVRQRSLKKGGRHYLLDIVIGEHLLEREARRRKLAPDFSGIKGHHEKLMKRFLREEFDSKLRIADISEEEVRAEYGRMRRELTEPFRREIHIYQTKTRDEADELLTRARAALESENDTVEVEDLFNELDMDEDGISPIKGQYGREGAETYFGEEIAQAIFAVDVDEGYWPELIKREQTWNVVLAISELQPPPVPSFEKIGRQARQRVHDRRREKLLNRFVDSFRGSHEVVIHEDAMELVPWYVEPPPRPAVDTAAPQ